jgi:anaerobic dimethyl sulfoxide reductase subunit C (anchor subunit)
MKERSLVAFTLLSQTAVGAFLATGACYFWIVARVGLFRADLLTRRAFLVSSALMGVGMLASLLHLGNPFKAYRALWNLRSSWLSREILFASLFLAGWVVFAGMQWLDVQAFAASAVAFGFTALCGLATVYSMAQVYRLRTVPAWDTWATPLAFFTTTLALGCLLAGSTVFSIDPESAYFDHSLSILTLVRDMLFWATLLLALELSGILIWAPGSFASLKGARRNGRAGQTELLLTSLRLAFTLIGAVLLACSLAKWIVTIWANTVFILAFCATLAAEILGRMQFYKAREGEKTTGLA